MFLTLYSAFNTCFLSWNTFASIHGCAFLCFWGMMAHCIMLSIPSSAAFILFLLSCMRTVSPCICWWVDLVVLYWIITSPFSEIFCFWYCACGSYVSNGVYYVHWFSCTGRADVEKAIAFWRMYRILPNEDLLKVWILFILKNRCICRLWKEHVAKA